MSDKYIEVFSQFEEVTGFFSTKEGATEGYPYDREDVFEALLRTPWQSYNSDKSLWWTNRYRHPSSPVQNLLLPLYATDHPK